MTVGGCAYLENRYVWGEDWNEEACLTASSRLVPGRWGLGMKKNVDHSIWCEMMEF